MCSRQAWVGDIIYLPYRVRPHQSSGWLYLTDRSDQCARKIAGMISVPESRG